MTGKSSLRRKNFSIKGVLSQSTSVNLKGLEGLGEKKRLTFLLSYRST